MRFPRITLLALLVSWTSGVGAWTPPTRVRLTDEAIRLMPPSLRLALERQREEVLRGALDPMRDEDGAAHRAPWNRHGGLADQIAERIEALARAVARPERFPDVARRFGELAHFVADAGFPPNAGRDVGGSRYAHFAEFCESRAPRFPLVFYGHEDPDLARDDYRSFALGVLERSEAEDRELARAYAAAGLPPDPAAFDDRSVPFAVASLSYSRSITDIVRAWLTAWGRADGDLGRTPYLPTPNPYLRSTDGPTLPPPHRSGGRLSSTETPEPRAERTSASKGSTPWNGDSDAPW